MLSDSCQKLGSTYSLVQIWKEDWAALNFIAMVTLNTWVTLSFFICAATRIFPKVGWDHWKVCKWMWTVFESEALMVYNLTIALTHILLEILKKWFFFFLEYRTHFSSHSLPHLYPSLLGHSWFSLDFRCIFCPAKNVLSSLIYLKHIYLYRLLGFLIVRAWGRHPGFILSK